MPRPVENHQECAREATDPVQPAKSTRVRMDVEKYYRRFRISDPSYLAVRRVTPVLIVAMKDYLNGRILDIGCGSKAKELLADSNIEEFVGLDHEDSRHDSSRVDLFGTAYDIPTKSGSYHGVLCTAVLEHLEEPQQALAEAYRVMKKGGYGIYTIPLFWHLHEEPRDFYRYTRFGISHLFESVGFEVVELRPLSGFWTTVASQWNHYLQVFARGPLKILVRIIVALTNLIVPTIDKLDMRLNPESERWTSSYLVVVRKS